MTRATHDGTMTKHQHRYILDEPVAYVPLGEGVSMHHVVTVVSVFLNAWRGEPRPTTVVILTNTGRSIMAGTGNTGPNDDPRILEMFADLIADAEQREQRDAFPYAPDERTFGQAYRDELARLCAELTGETYQLRNDTAAAVLLAPGDAHAVAMTPGSTYEHRTTVTLDGAPVPHAGHTGPAVESAHYCQHGNRAHACTCPANESHSGRVCVLTFDPANA
jgi:hypothetical protein